MYHSFSLTLHTQDIKLLYGAGREQEKPRCTELDCTHSLCRHIPEMATWLGTLGTESASPGDHSSIINMIYTHLRRAYSVYSDEKRDSKDSPAVKVVCHTKRIQSKVLGW